MSSDAPKDGGWPTPCQSQEQADAMLAITVYGTGSEFEAIQTKELKSMKGITDRINEELQEARRENDELRAALMKFDDFDWTKIPVPPLPIWHELNGIIAHARVLLRGDDGR
jgi:hypothetical protein